MMNRHVVIVPWVLSFLAGAAATALALDAPQSPPGQLALRTSKVVVFKDGYALFIKQATGVADASGGVFTHDVPDAAVLGSFWAGSDRNQIVAMRAEWDSSWQRVDQPARGATLDLPALLGRLQDKQVTLALASGQAIEGKCVQIVAVKNEPHVMIETGPGQTEIVPLFDIREVRGEAAAKVIGGGTPTFRQAKRLSFDMGKDAAGKPVNLTLMHFGPGLRWIPTYRLSGELKDSADLALQGEILNEAEDLRDVALDLVVGVPSFRFREVISPLSLEAALRHTLRQAAPQLMGQMSNAMFTQRAGEWRNQAQPAAQPGDGGGMAEVPPEIVAAGEQDLFIYSVERFSLRAGGRATMPLWQSTVPLRHLYTLDLRPRRHPNSGHVIQPEAIAGGRDPSPLRLLTNHFWHQLELSNTSRVPWTTGAAMTVRGQVPLGQDLLTYTPVKGSSLLPLTVAVDLRGTLEEEEISREPNARLWNKHQYARIVKKGTITLTSYRAAPSQVRVALSVGGRITDADENADIRINEYAPDDWHAGGGGLWLNNHSDVTWDLTLDPGQTRTLTYTCEFFVP